MRLRTDTIPARPRSRALWLAGLGLLCLGFVAACPQKPAFDAPRGRVVILGVDGLDHVALKSLVEQDQLPNFARMMQDGVFGLMSTYETGLPPISTRIWTSVATGVPTQAHKIDSFFYVDEAGNRRMLTGAHREAAAAWQIVSDENQRVGVVNWWFTYPVEEVDGFIVTDRFIESWARRSAKFWKADHQWDATRIVYPPALEKTLREIDEVPKAAGADPSSAEDKDRYIFGLTYAALKAEAPVDLLMVYTRALDEMSHTKWHTHEPLPGEKPVRDLVVEYMIRYDRMLGEFLEHLTPNDTLFILSDHGFERATKPMNALGIATTGEHQSKKSAHGVFLMKGPRIQQGATIGTVSVYDVLPTTLELLGIPAADDMPGKVIRRAFRDPEFQTLPRVAKYERRDDAPVAAEDGRSEEEAERIKHLRALGYLE